MSKIETNNVIKPNFKMQQNIKMDERAGLVGKNEKLIKQEEEVLGTRK